MCASAPALRVFFRTYLSDPITRAIHSARGGAGSTIRSNNTARIGSINYSQTQSPTPARYPFSEAKSNHSISTIDEQDVDVEAISIRSAVPSAEQMVVRTPAEFESYALQNLQKNRPPMYTASSRPVYARELSDNDLSYAKQPSGGWHAL